MYHPTATFAAVRLTYCGKYTIFRRFLGCENSDLGGTVAQEDKSEDNPKLETAISCLTCAVIKAVMDHGTQT
jgi:hypothetical protein